MTGDFPDGLVLFPVEELSRSLWSQAARRCFAVETIPQTMPRITRLLYLSLCSSQADLSASRPANT